MPVLLDDNTAVLSTASTHERPFGGFIGKLDSKSVSKAQRFVDERLTITRKVRDAMASAQDKQKQDADQHGRKNNEHFSVGDKVLLSTATLPKHAISVLPGGTTKLLPRFIGPFTVVEEVGDLNYRLTLPPYMKTHPVFYVGRLKRYVDPQEITYPHQSNETDGDADCESSVVADQATVKPKGFPYTRPTTEDSVIEEDSALDVGLSSPVAHVCPSGPSGGHTPDDPSYSRSVDPKSVARLDSTDPLPLSSAQRSPPATERQQDRQPRIVGRNRRSYRAPPVGERGREHALPCRKAVGPPVCEAKAPNPRPVEGLPDEL